MDCAVCIESEIQVDMRCDILLAILCLHTLARAVRQRAVSATHSSV
jgi:hypothetical protein